MPLDLRQALDAAVRQDIRVPPEIDEAILDDARRRLRGIRRRGPVVLVLRTAGLAAAACAVVAVGVTFLAGHRTLLAPTRFAFSRQDMHETASTGDAAAPTRGVGKDIDGDGRVDIRDAFMLARRIERGIRRSAWDFNGDGVVDRADVDLVAMAAVRLGEEAVR